MAFLFFVFIVVIVSLVVWVIKSQNQPPTALQAELAEKMYGSKEPEPDYGKLLEE